LQQPIRVWHGSATSRESVDLAARWGDPLFSANVTNPIEPYADGLTDKQHRATLELFQQEVAPALRREIPSRPFPGALP
jgi:alkanesulfonate monooxygenase SsuD/methylene tetrahydromethanopterin reductase-like flavin-dependent oxidoreductase (luciferase family)